MNSTMNNDSINNDGLRRVEAMSDCITALEGLMNALREADVCLARAQSTLYDATAMLKDMRAAEVIGPCDACALDLPDEWGETQMVYDDDTLAQIRAAEAHDDRDWIDDFCDRLNKAAHEHSLDDLLESLRADLADLDALQRDALDTEVCDASEA